MNMGRKTLSPAEAENSALSPAATDVSRFDLAAARAMGRYTAEQWAMLEPFQRSQAIYAELRRLDAGLAAAAE